MSTKLKIGILYGSNRVGRFCDVIAGWVEQETAKHRHFDLVRIDPLDYDLPVRFGEPSEAADRLRATVGVVDAFVVVTPEYNHSYTSALKQLIDNVKLEWQAKPVGFVSYGGVSGGLRAVEHLRAVFAETHSVTMRDAVSFADYWTRFCPDGQPIDPIGPAKSLNFMLDHIEWWAQALKQARKDRSYQAIAA
jgi:NAD(P)H-dependent FMN reductase